MRSRAAPAVRCRDARLSPAPGFVLIDAVSLPRLTTPQRAIIKGDSLSLSIAAASIMAKVYRDRLMCDLHQKYPQYGFQQHKGYGTKEHLEAIRTHGPCPIHRKSFKGVREYLRPA